MRTKTREARELGKQLRVYRRRRGWTQAKVSFLTGIHSHQISDLERGRSLSLENLLKIRTFIGDNHA